MTPVRVLVFVFVGDEKEKIFAVQQNCNLLLNKYVYLDFRFIYNHSLTFTAVKDRISRVAAKIVRPEPWLVLSLFTRIPKKLCTSPKIANLSCSSRVLCKFYFLIRVKFRKIFANICEHFCVLCVSRFLSQFFQFFYFSSLFCRPLPRSHPRH